MTVKELIKMLNNLNQNDEVFTKSKNGIEKIINVASSDDADYNEIYLETTEE